jgi:hypothetical protein
MIDWLADEDPSTSTLLSWKSDFGKVRDAIEDLPCPKDDFSMQENAVLKPKRLERINKIYKRWS